MIGYIGYKSEIGMMPETIDASRQSTIQLYSMSALSCDCPDIDISQSDYIYTCDISKVPDGQQVTFSNETDTCTVTIYNEAPNTAYLKQWLTMQQMPELIDIFEKIGWSKLKEAALKAKQITDWQGTEKALQMMLELLETDQNVQLYRYWHKSNEFEDDTAFDNLTATDLADLGYALTGKLRLVYKEDSLNPWSSTIYDNVKSMIVTLDELVTCLKHVLPANLVISDCELIRVGIGMIMMNYTSCQTTLQTSDTTIDVPVSFNDVLQYSYESFVYNTDTLELIRIADNSEVNANGQYMCIFDIRVEGTIYDFCLHLGDMLLRAEKLSGQKHFCLQPKPGEYDVLYEYTTETGNRFSKTKHVSVIKACSRQDIYELVEPDYSNNNTAMQIEEGNISNFMHQWMQVSECCNGRPVTIAVPKPYQCFYIDGVASEIRIIDALGNIETISTLYGKFSSDKFTLHGMGVKEFLFDSKYGAGYKTWWAELMSIKPMGKYDYHVQYRGDLGWQDAPQLTKYLSSTTEPMWTVEELDGLLHNLGTWTTAKISIGGHYANNGGYMPVKIDNAFIRRIEMSDNAVCNVDQNGNLVSISCIANEADFTVEYADKASLHQVRRAPSFALKPMEICKESVPYVAYKPHTWIELVSNGHVVALAYGLLVFAKTTGNNYQLHMYNDWYDKTIQL